MLTAKWETQAANIKAMRVEGGFRPQTVRIVSPAAIPKARAPINLIPWRFPPTYSRSQQATPWPPDWFWRTRATKKEQRGKKENGKSGAWFLGKVFLVGRRMS
jgi:hypothetical protein